MHTGADFHADQARQQVGDQRQELGTRNPGFGQLGLAVLVDAVNRKNVLGEIYPHGDNAHDIPLSVV
jgi:hypothetical protein